MEKFKLNIIATAGLFASSIALAGTDLSSYYTSMHPKKEVALKTLSTKMHPPTNVTVINASSSNIYVSVSGAPVHDYLNSRSNDHVYNYDSNIWSTPLLLEDPYGRIFYDKDVCRLAIVTVYGYPGNYFTNTDSDLCK